MARTALASLTIAVLALAGCGKRVPGEVKPVLEAERATALKVAEDAAQLCSRVEVRQPGKPLPIPTPPVTPGKGTSLETNPKVQDVMVTCSFPDLKSPDIWVGTGIPSLKKTDTVPPRKVTMPEDLYEDTCKANAQDCVQVIVPSRFSTNERSADLRIVRPTVDPGTGDKGYVEVRVIIVP